MGSAAGPLHPWDRSISFARRATLIAAVACIAALGLLFVFAIQVEAQSPAASPAGDACRKEICNGAVTDCMRADQSLNPFARTEAEKKQYCAQFLDGCLTRNIVADLPWYSPETVARFLRCPS